MSSDLLQDVAEITSLVLTFPTVVLAAAVILLWTPASLNALRSRPFKGRDWFVVGVVIGFFGSLMDNLYWAAAWSSSYFNLRLESSLFSFGVFPNILFRQTLGSLAAYCHLRAAMSDMVGTTKVVNGILLVCHVGALTVLGMLLLLR